MMWQSPQHIRGKHPDAELCYVRPPNLKRNLYMFMAQRKGAMRKIVYDLRHKSKTEKRCHRTKFVRKLKPMYSLQAYIGP